MYLRIWQCWYFQKIWKNIGWDMDMGEGYLRICQSWYFQKILKNIDPKCFFLILMQNGSESSYNSNHFALSFFFVQIVKRNVLNANALPGRAVRKRILEQKSLDHYSETAHLDGRLVLWPQKLLANCSHNTMCGKAKASPKMFYKICYQIKVWF